ncbi:unnamed protein product, partial [Ectocarpus sp. 4 AP-2014]
MQATEILLRRLREGSDASNTKSSGRSINSSSGSGGVTSNDNGDDDGDPGAPQDCFSPIELATLVHGYSPEDARRALTICHEMRTLESAGVGRVAAAQELTRRVRCGTGAVVGGGGGGAGKAELGVR